MCLCGMYWAYCYLLCALTIPHVGHCKTGFSGLVDDMRLRTPAATTISSSVGDGVHWWSSKLLALMSLEQAAQWTNKSPKMFNTKVGAGLRSNGAVPLQQGHCMSADTTIHCLMHLAHTRALHGSSKGWLTTSRHRGDTSDAVELKLSSATNQWLVRLPRDLEVVVK